MRNMIRRVQKLEGTIDASNGETMRQVINIEFVSAVDKKVKKTLVLELGQSTRPRYERTAEFHA